MNGSCWKKSGNFRWLLHASENKEGHGGCTRCCVELVHAFLIIMQIFTICLLSVADLSGSSKTITICQSPCVYRPCNLDHSNKAFELPTMAVISEEGGWVQVVAVASKSRVSRYYGPSVWLAGTSLIHRGLVMDRAWSWPVEAWTRDLRECPVGPSNRTEAAPLIVSQWMLNHIGIWGICRTGWNRELFFEFLWAIPLQFLLWGREGWLHLVCSGVWVGGVCKVAST